VTTRIVKIHPVRTISRKLPFLVSDSNPTESSNDDVRTREWDIEQALAGSSETAREAPRLSDLQFPLEGRQSRLKIQSDPHGDMGSQAEMIWPLKIGE
jgi:hypothetical protein